MSACAIFWRDPHTSRWRQWRPSAPLTAYCEQTGNRAGRSYGEGFAGFGDATRWLLPGDVVTEAAMTAVFRAGVDLVTDDALGRAYSRCDDAKRRAVVGHDLTLTASKSVSVLWVGPVTRRVIVHHAHRAALASSPPSSRRRRRSGLVIGSAIGTDEPGVVRSPGSTPARLGHPATYAGRPAISPARPQQPWTPGLHSLGPHRLTAPPPPSADGPVAGP